MYFGNTKIIEIENNLTQEEKRRNLKKIYDITNEIGKELFSKGKDISKYFLSNLEYEKLQKEKNNLI